MIACICLNMHALYDSFTLGISWAMKHIIWMIISWNFFCLTIYHYLYIEQGDDKKDYMLFSRVLTMAWNFPLKRKKDKVMH